MRYTLSSKTNIEQFLVFILYNCKHVTFCPAEMGTFAFLALGDCALGRTVFAFLLILFVFFGFSLELVAKRLSGNFLSVFLCV